MTSRVSRDGLQIGKDLTVLDKADKETKMTLCVLDGQKKSLDRQCGTPSPSLKLGKYSDLPHDFTDCELIEVLKGSHAISPQKEASYNTIDRDPLECQKSNDLGYTEHTKTSRTSGEIGSDLRVIQAKLDRIESIERELRLERLELERLKDKLQNEIVTTSLIAEGRPKEPDPPGNQAVIVALRDTLREMRLPRLEIEPFSGSPEEFVCFMNAFDTSVASKITDPNQKLAYLIHYCQGRARQAIKHCVLLPEASGYDTAVKILTDYFGKPYTIVQAVMKDLLQGPPVQMELNAL